MKGKNISFLEGKNISYQMQKYLMKHLHTNKTNNMTNYLINLCTTMFPGISWALTGYLYNFLKEPLIK